MSPPWQPPAFSLEAWYSDPADHRCPQDACLESIDVREPAKEALEAERAPAIILKLLGAYHDGWIVLSYFGVRSHSLCAYLCDQGVGEWLRDEFTKSDAGLTTHRITWCSDAGRTDHWLIEADRITYQWLPKTP